MVTADTITLQLGLYHTTNATLPLDCYSMLGGYPIAYYTDNMSVLCGECATKQVLATRDSDYIVCVGDTVTVCDLLEGSYEDHGLVLCENCNTALIDFDDDMTEGQE